MQLCQMWSESDKARRFWCVRKLSITFQILHLVIFLARFFLVNFDLLSNLQTSSGIYPKFHAMSNRFCFEFGWWVQLKSWIFRIFIKSLKFYQSEDLSFRALFVKAESWFSNVSRHIQIPSNIKLADWEENWLISWIILKNYCNKKRSVIFLYFIVNIS